MNQPASVELLSFLNSKKHQRTRDSAQTRLAAVNTFKPLLRLTNQDFLDIFFNPSFSLYPMKLSPNQMNKIALEIFKELSQVDNLELHFDKEKFKKTIAAVLKQNMEDEKVLDQSVNDMMDSLEKQNPGGFERYKMFPLLKKKLAEQKGFVL